MTDIQEEIFLKILSYKSPKKNFGREKILRPELHSFLFQLH